MGFEPMKDKSLVIFKITAINQLDQFSLRIILSRVELEFHSYQKCTLPLS